MEILAPAKVNLSLLVKHRREDGFHEVETLMCPVSVFDTLAVAVTSDPSIEFTCDDPSIPDGEANLVVRAAKLFCADVGIEPSLRISLHKEIPHGAGLGGGSSDAAATLLTLNALFETELPRATLASMAAEIGADVPFFIYQSAAICRGRGEQVQPITFSERLPLLFVKPPFGVPTPWAYEHWSKRLPTPLSAGAPKQFPWGALVNDLEEPVFEKYLFLELLKKWLNGQPEVQGALMSGSGSTVFAILANNAAAPVLAEKIAAEFGTNLWVRLCETLPSSPVAS